MSWVVSLALAILLALPPPATALPLLQLNTGAVTTEDVTPPETEPTPERSSPGAPAPEAPPPPAEPAPEQSVPGPPSPEATPQPATPDHALLRVATQLALGAAGSLVGALVGGRLWPNTWFAPLIGMTLGGSGGVWLGGTAWNGQGLFVPTLLGAGAGAALLAAVIWSPLGLVLGTPLGRLLLGAPLAGAMLAYSFLVPRELKAMMPAAVGLNLAPASQELHASWVF